MRASARTRCSIASMLTLFVRLALAQPVEPQVRLLGATGNWLDAERDHLALSREMPATLGEGSEPEAVRVVFIGFDVLPTGVRLSTHRQDGFLIDSSFDPKLSSFRCPQGSRPGPCWATDPLRLTPDRLDREYAAARSRSLEAELGGELQVAAGNRALGSWRVGTPHSALFAPYQRLSLALRVRVLRLSPGGAPAVGVDERAALRIARSELLAASKLWGQCGIDLFGASGAEVELVDPPPVQLLAVGCETGLPASGGQINLSVQGRRVRVATRAGEPPRVVAERLARALRARGLTARLSVNPRISSGASGAVDVLVRGALGQRVTLGADPDPKLPLSSDATLGVCLGEVDLGDGLTHFVENDAAAGTLEERALIKAFDDGNPSTIEVFIIPSFDQSGRIGESFIDDGPGIQNTVIIDRAAVRAGPRSYALAHELGHILLDMPNHPDDYGVDQAQSLMDSDASDASVFGPRRLSLEDCERALRQSGPDATIPLLTPWPFRPRESPAGRATSAR